ncbi:MAG: cupredoxin domain-containing protein, partial [Nitrososphaera sp.]
MSHDEHGHDKEPIIPTSGRRLGKGLLIVGITLVVGAAILVPFFDDLYKNPPPVSLIRAERPPPTEPPEAGTTTIAILQGASAQGSPDYDPDAAQVPLGNKIVWENQDTVPHTATSGANDKDPEKGSLFDTSIISPNEKSKAIDLADAKEGDTINYFCTLHPYMTSELTIAAAGAGAGQGGNQSDVTGGGAAAGTTLNILEGASAQGAPAYDPDPITAKKGDEINVVNQDAVPHTVTSGTGNSDPEKGSL